MERKKKRDAGGFYIAVCCCAVIIAVVGYANRMSLEDKTENTDIAEKIRVAATPVPTPAAKAEEPAVSAEPSHEVPVSKAVADAEDFQFSAPVSGSITEEFSGDDLVYNEALKDWRAHSGVDFAASTGEQVLCCANGVVEDVFDSNLGRCVTIDHKNGFKTMYANLNETTAVKAGDEVAEGDVIGTVGNTALGDSTDEPHLHFEIVLNGENVNPAEYLE